MADALRRQAAQELLVDLVVHFVKAHGRTAPKVFTFPLPCIRPARRAPAVMPWT
jgi:hypothetical protein